MLLSRALARRTILLQTRPMSAQGYGDNHTPAAQKSGTQEQSGGKPQPKIWDQKEPSGDGNPEVEKHNREMERRYGKAEGEGGEPVGKEYWKGMGGRDREP